MPRFYPRHCRTVRAECALTTDETSGGGTTQRQWKWKWKSKLQWLIINTDINIRSYMKNTLRNIFAPILNLFEKGETQYIYKASYRTILKLLGLLFLFLSCVSLLASLKASQLGGMLPFLVFLVIGIVCEIVAFLGSDRAVANIWRNR